MKTAILLTGNLRNWENCKDSFNRFFNEIEYDLFVAVYDKQYSLHPYNLIQTPVTERSVNYNTIKELFPNAKEILIVNQKEQMETLQIVKFDPEIKWPFPGGYDIFSQFTLFQKGLDLIPKEYDIIIKTRPDCLYHSKPLNVNVLQTVNSLNLIGLTNGGTPEICDHIFVGKEDIIRRIPEQVFNCFYKKPVNCDNIHTFLKSFIHDYIPIANSSINRVY